jgi:hypothetical protein
MSVQKPLNEVQEDWEQEDRLQNSMDSYNRRGCDEIMCQFIKDLDSSYEIKNQAEIEEVIKPNKHFSVNIETIE